MSIYGALFAGVSGLSANSVSLGIISDNIANVNTVGYKRHQSSFSTLVTGSGSSTFSPGGVRAGSRLLMDHQGLILGSESPTDLAISGDGFFVTSTAPTTSAANTPVFYTRAGSFVKDANGYLRNAAGYYLLGWPVASNGTVPATPSDLTQLQSLNLESIGGTAEPTTNVTLNANLQASQAVSVQEATYAAGTSANNMASGNVTPDFESSIQIFDTQGGFRTLTLSLLKSATPNQWHAELHMVPSTDVTTGAGLIDGQVAVGTIAFTPNGLLDTGATSPSLLNVDFLASGAAPGAGEVAWTSGLGIGAQSVAISLGTSGSFTQFDSPSNLISYQVDGAVFGGLAGVRVDEKGFVTALFDNGVQRRIYQIPVATFINPSGLQAENGNAYSVTNDSGPFNLKIPGDAGAGKISAASLESSTVDIAEEFTGLITTQRAYSAATRIITTADEMLNELIQTRR